MGLFSRLFSKVDHHPIAAFVQQNFGFRPRNLDYYERAFRHKSVSVEKDKRSNERLEFLGDAVLDLAVAHFLFDRFPHGDEGDLSKMKSKIVSRSFLNQIAEEMGVTALIDANLNTGAMPENLKGNALEAVIGAIYLDRGYIFAEKCLQTHFIARFVRLDDLLKRDEDYKSQLIIWAQRERKHLEFSMEEETMKNGQKKYKATILIDQKTFKQGTGTSKKSAEQEASKYTLQIIQGK